MNGHANGHAKSAQTIAATYDYVDEAGALQFQAVRYAPKAFRQRRPDGKAGISGIYMASTR